jgi:hypothetical protein
MGGWGQEYPDEIKEKKTVYHKKDPQITLPIPPIRIGSQERMWLAFPEKPGLIQLIHLPSRNK